MRLREILNFQLTGEKYLMECTTSTHKITRENIQDMCESVHAQNIGSETCKVTIRAN